MIPAPTIDITIGGLPTVRCYLARRSEGIVPRFDILDGEDPPKRITSMMLREWFHGEGFSELAGIDAMTLCVEAARAMHEWDPL